MRQFNFTAEALQEIPEFMENAKLIVERGHCATISCGGCPAWSEHHLGGAPSCVEISGGIGKPEYTQFFRDFLAQYGKR